MIKRRIVSFFALLAIANFLSAHDPAQGILTLAMLTKHVMPEIPNDMPSLNKHVRDQKLLKKEIKRQCRKEMKKRSKANLRSGR